MNVDASLQYFMDPYINIARATVAKDACDEELVKAVLLAFGGLGLAKREVRGRNGTRWIPTDRLNEFTDPAELPADITPVMETIEKRKDKPEMAKSLRLIIADMVAVRRQVHPKFANNTTLDAILLTLAGNGAVSLVEAPSGNMVWVAEPDLIDQFESTKNGRGSHRRSTILMDEVLKIITDQFSAPAKKRGCTTLNERTKRTGIIRMLLNEEIRGNAIVYKNSKGRLGWKASPDLRNLFE